LITKGGHGGTFCGNPLSCAVAVAVLDHLRAQNIADKVARSGKLMIDGLHEPMDMYPSLVGPIRGKGLLCAFELDSDPDSDPDPDPDPDHMMTKVTEAAISRGLLVTPTRNRVIPLTPALIVTQPEMVRGLKLLESLLASVVTRH